MWGQQSGTRVAQIQAYDFAFCFPALRPRSLREEGRTCLGFRVYKGSLPCKLAISQDQHPGASFLAAGATFPDSPVLAAVT